MHDAGELATALAELLLGLTRQTRTGAGAVHDEDASYRGSSELLADLVRLVERLERLGDGPEVEGPGLNREESYVGGDRGALRDVT